MATVLSKTQNLADSFLARACARAPTHIHTHEHSLGVCEEQTFWDMILYTNSCITMTMEATSSSKM